jgi:hypothetical protein
LVDRNQRSSETCVHICKTVRCHIPEDHNITLIINQYTSNFSFARTNMFIPSMRTHNGPLSIRTTIHNCFRKTFVFLPARLHFSPSLSVCFYFVRLVEMCTVSGLWDWYLVGLWAIHLMSTRNHFREPPFFIHIRLSTAIIHDSILFNNTIRSQHIALSLKDLMCLDLTRPSLGAYVFD